MKALFYLLLFLPSGTFAQSVETAADLRFFGTDAMGFSYFERHNELYKQKGAERVQYQHFGLGRVHSIDLQNPLLTVVFYRDFNTCVLLDSQFSEMSRINFNQWPEPLQPLAIGLASQNRLWVYDALSMRIGLVHQNQPHVRFVTQNLQHDLIHSQSNFNYFDWVDANRRWFRVDVYGKTSDLGTLPEFEAAQLLDKGALLLQAGKLWLWKADSGARPLAIGPENSITAFWWNGQNLTIFTGEGISNHKIDVR